MEDDFTLLGWAEGALKLSVAMITLEKQSFNHSLQSVEYHHFARLKSSRHASQS